MIALTVNGTPREVDAPADRPLLWVLREDLGIVGPKFGCGVAACGACTVHADGQAVRSCSHPVSEFAGRSIVTIEGLGEGQLHPVQRAWIEEQVPQRGYSIGLPAQGNTVENPPMPFPTTGWKRSSPTASCRSASGVRSAIRTRRSSMKASSTRSRTSRSRIRSSCGGSCWPASRAISRCWRRWPRRPGGARRWRRIRDGALHPEIVRMQLESGIIYGLSAAPYGEITLKSGAVEQSNVQDYDAVRLADAPEMAVHLMDSRAEVVGGVGEPGTSPIAPAVANATFEATDQRLRSLPLRIA